MIVDDGATTILREKHYTIINDYKNPFLDKRNESNNAQTSRTSFVKAARTRKTPPHGK